MNFIKRTIFSIMLIADSKPTTTDKIQYFINIILTCAPIAYLLDGLNLWFTTNQKFASFILVCLFANMVIGCIFHHKTGTFSWERFFKRNILMWIYLIVVYGILEMLRQTVGDNFVGESFRVLIQLTSLLYPGSKVLKNIYILSNKQFPPEFIMEKIYNFEKSGNIKDLLDTDINNKNE